MKATIDRLLILTLLLFLYTQLAQAQKDDSKFDFYARGPYRENVPRPQSTLRFDVGEFHTTYALMEQVIEKIAKAAPDRVRITDIGETNEHRMMHLIAISSPENIARLDEIKANMARLSDPRKTTPQEAQSIVANQPVVVWFSYTIHGNESAGFETMMQVLYQLAASNEPATLDILKNCVVLLNVCSNPDGHERFATWYNSVAVGDPENFALEHREPWSVHGRFSHYRFDLNRDNATSTQKETQNMQRAYLEWNPQVFADHHGQPTRYFFPPAALPINPNLPLAQTERWLTEFGRANAAQFDANQWDYYVRDIFDLFYPGYWDSWPCLNGATGMTYETDGGGFKGINWLRDDGTIVTFRSAIAKHFVASMTTLETSAKNREARLRDYYDFKRTGIEEAAKEKLKRVIILPGKDARKAQELIAVLERAGVEVKRASAQFSSSSAHSYINDTGTTNKSFPAGSYVIDLAQPQKRLIKALIEPDTPQDDAFVKDQLARFVRNQRRGGGTVKEEYGFYDITAWSLPLAFGIEAYWTEDAPALSQTRVFVEQEPEPGVIGGRARIAYIIPYESDGAGALVYRLQKLGYRVAVSYKTLNTDNREWPRGTFVVRNSRNPESLHDAIDRLAKELGVKVYSSNTGFNEKGDNGIGGENVLPLSQPRIAVLADEGVDQTSYGALWWTLDRYGIDFTPLTFNAATGGALDKYNVFIIPDGSPDRYFSAFGKGGIDSLHSWVRKGGALVCFKGASVFAALKDANFTSSRLVGSDEDDGADAPKLTPQASPSPSPQDTGRNKKDKKSATEQLTTESTKTDKMDAAPPVLPLIASPSARPERVPEGVPGAIFRATVDRTTFLTFGFEEPTLPVLVNSGYFFRPSKEGNNAVMFLSENNAPLRVSGFVWPNNTEKLLSATAYIIGESEGRGNVILFADDPNFRGIFRSTTKLFFNSFLLTAQ